MFGSSPTDAFEQKAQKLRRAVERARMQFLQKTRPQSTTRTSGVLTGSYFDYLPVELIINICCETDWRAVTRLRLVSCAFKDLVDANESTIATRWMVPGSYLALLSQLFYPPRSKSGDGVRRPTIQYFYGLEKRHNTCSQLAYYLCDKAIAPMYRTQFTINRKDREEAKLKKDQAIRTVQRKLTKQLYFVLHFLTYSRLRLEANKAALAAENSDEPLTPSDLNSAYLSIQSSIISTFDNQTLISTHHALHFLVNSIRLSMSPEPPHKQNDELVAIILRCHMPLNRCVEFFAADCPGAPWGLKKQFMQDMEEERADAENKFGGAAALRRSSSGHSREASRRKWSPKVTEVWFEAAKVALAQRGLQEHKPDGVYFFPECSQELLIGCPGCKLK
ncbi:hypothetical protein L873DRAFT_1737855 [Choiromyces venosus 120613-1]|uniref:F-box domain-containing protein n=1 Tax=Choiromyces venosus 120613-1 TaxID=1336337 RepID=A0A3N4JRZ1_9PEZI|nr:hypothetical protein L873DRAFT_1737855 [Choiromyces venosus 120613-1]